MSDEEIRQMFNTLFEDEWRKLKETPRGRMIAKTTRKYVAKYFFYAGMNTILQAGKGKTEKE